MPYKKTSEKNGRPIKKREKEPKLKKKSNITLTFY